jgi:hypothetical protein
MDPCVSSSYERYLAVDLHKHYVVIGGLNARQEIILPPRRMDLSEWPAWAKKNLRKTDILVVEATTNAWDFYDQVSPLVGRVVVANAGKIAGLVKTRVKTDRIDVLKLAKLLVAGMIPEVWVPPYDVRELRALMAHRRQLVKICTMLKNRLQSILHRHQLVPPEGELFSDKNRAWWNNLPVSATKEGRRDLRWALVEAAWIAVENHPHWKNEFERLSRRMDKNKAIVAIAHKLLVAVWHVLTEYVADKHAEPAMVATKLMRWSWDLTDEQRGGLSTRQFVRLGLMHLKLGENLTHLTYGNLPRRISSVDELLAVRPDLRSLLENPVQPTAP